MIGRFLVGSGGCRRFGSTGGAGVKVARQGETDREPKVKGREKSIVEKRNKRTWMSGGKSRERRAH